MAEWLRRWTANPLGFAREGSNPFFVVFFKIFIHLYDFSASDGKIFYFLYSLNISWFKFFILFKFYEIRIHKLKTNLYRYIQELIIYLEFFISRFYFEEKILVFVKNRIKYSIEKIGDKGDRSPDLPHAKRTLYHWAISPNIIFIFDLLFVIRSLFLDLKT